MKKIFVYIISLITICFILPAIFTTSTKQTSSNAENNENVELEVNSTENQDSQENQETNNTQSIDNQNADNNNDNSKYSKIKLLHAKSGEVEEVELESYLCNVVSAEMPADFEKEALKAQSIVARTYTIYKINNKKHDNADICDNSSCCQAWVSKEERFSRWEEDKREEKWQKINEAVKETKGKVVTYDNQPINAFFHSNSGGITEVPINVWGGSNYPYLQVVETAGEDGYTQYSSEAIFSQEELINKLKTRYGDIKINFANEEEIKILDYTESKRVKTVKFGNHNLSGVETRTILGLKSSNFEITKEDNKIKFSVKGYGHGVGMSQTGADSLAKQGKNAEEIIHHFYNNVEIKDVSNL